ncbi:MAG: glutathione S-transferase family protein [Solirubrobacteraceae bacterium]
MAISPDFPNPQQRPGKATLYTLAISHPGLAVIGMLSHAGVEHDVVELWPGTHPVALRLRGFAGPTVPALRWGSRRLQNSREIARLIDQQVPTRPLFPRAGPDRARVERAEAWGEETFQELPRRIFRFVAAQSPAVRRWLAATAGVPLPNLVARERRVARAFADRSAATGETVRADIARLPLHLDYVGELLDSGVIGGEVPNAADFQIAATIRSLQGIGDLAEFIDRHPVARWAAHVLPTLPGPCPSALPADWTLTLRTAPILRPEPPTEPHRPCAGSPT